jgi:hypothetical protein
MRQGRRIHPLSGLLKQDGGCGETGRRKGLKIPRWRHRAGSIPASRTIRQSVMHRRDGLRPEARFFLPYIPILSTIPEAAVVSGRRTRRTIAACVKAPAHRRFINFE